MKRKTAQWVLKAEEDYQGARLLAARDPPLTDLACFHCQQAAEKYLKALLQDRGLTIPKIHDLEELLDLLLAVDATLAPLRRRLDVLNDYAVDYRYPGERATKRRMQAALRHVEIVRKELRARLGASA